MNTTSILNRFVLKGKDSDDWKTSSITIALIMLVLIALVAYTLALANQPTESGANVAALSANPELMAAHRFVETSRDSMYVRRYANPLVQKYAYQAVVAAETGSLITSPELRYARRYTDAQQALGVRRYANPLAEKYTAVAISQISLAANPELMAVRRFAAANLEWLGQRRYVNPLAEKYITTRNAAVLLAASPEIMAHLRFVSAIVK